VTVGALSGTIGSITDEGASAGTTTLTVNLATDSTFGGTINNGAGRTLAVTKSGAATLTLKGGNTFTGPLNITNGAVIAAGDVDVPIVSNVNLGDGSNDVWLIAGAFGNQFGASTEINFTNAAKNAKFQLRGFNQTVAGLNANLDSQTSLAIIQNDEPLAPGYIGDPGAANFDHRHRDRSCLHRTDSQSEWRRVGPDQGRHRHTGNQERTRADG
jgi:autotransporter-associated beta strand protein